MEYLVEILQLAEGEHMKKNSVAIVGWHPAQHDMLKVFHATEEAELKMGQNVRQSSKEPAAIAALEVSTARSTQT